jgi:hypothetical protein
MANLSASLSPLNETLVAFDDTSEIAFNLPRELVVDTTIQMQEIRRKLAFTEVADCLLPLKASYLDYMDSVIDVLVSFISGASPSQTQAGLTNMQPFREGLESEYASLLGVTMTPYPTSYTEGLIPVTGAEQPAQVGTATTTPHEALAVVSNPRGANLRFGPSLNYSFTYVLDPGTAVEMIALSADNQWVYVEVPGLNEGQGWIFLPLLSIESAYELLPVITEDSP